MTKRRTPLAPPRRPSREPRTRWKAAKPRPLSFPTAAARRSPSRSCSAAATSCCTFTPRTSTPGCTAEACDFRDTAPRLKAAGAQVVGISADSPESHRKFTDKHELNFPLLSDSGNRVTRLYGVYKKKSLYGREFMGIERTTFVIDREGVIRKVFPKVKVASHADAVLEAVKALR